MAVRLSAYSDGSGTEGCTGAERLAAEEHSIVDAMPAAIDFVVCAIQTSPPHHAHADADPDGS
jgi:hypothetical protein